ncbi:MAG TPA: dipicolinate synthase subunit B, partial [Syntrophomonas sp.]|nr:dipicolinate synthase subunit B [Syntrophomonas sp.]
MNTVLEKRLDNIRIGVVVTGSHCTVGEIMLQLKRLREAGAELYTIFSYTADQTDNRFYRVDDLKQEIHDITGRGVINSIVGAEPIGPQKLLDVVAVMPATGNSIAKFANGIVDTPALMAMKAQLRNQRPVVIAISTNDGLGLNAKNIGLLLNTKNIYFVPFRQDNPMEKSNSLQADMDLVYDTIVSALEGKQLQPVLL